MFTWKDYYSETQRRQDEIAQAAQYRLVQSVLEPRESNITKMRVRILDAVGSRLVQWGSKLQCCRAELPMTASKRAI